LRAVSEHLKNSIRVNWWNSWRFLLTTHSTSRPAATTKPVERSVCIPLAKIRRIRVHRRAIVHTDGPLINADAADLRGSRRRDRKRLARGFCQKKKVLRICHTNFTKTIAETWMTLV